MVQLTKEESRAISIAKVICMFGVVYIHAAISKYVDCSPAVTSYYNFLTRGLVMFAVPGFFMCSGFLFFLNYKGLESYGRKLKSRIRGLAVPYVFWISLSLLVTFFIQDVLGLSQLFGAGKMKLIHDFTLMDVVQSYWNVRDGGPFLSTMWFLKDLMVCVLLAPLLFQVLRFGKWSLLAVLAFVAASFVRGSIATVGVSSIMYFAIGGGCSINGIKPFSFVSKHGKVICIIALFLMVGYSYSYTEEAPSCVYGYKALSIAYCVMMLLAVLAICQKIENKKIGGKLLLLGVPSYFIYLAHEPWMGYLLQMILKAAKHHGIVYQLTIVLIPVVYPMFIIGLFYGVFRILKRYTPRLLSVAVGGKI